jgi:hypothetical protein
MGIGQHVQYYEASLNGRDAAQARKRRLDALHQQRHCELANGMAEGGRPATVSRLLQDNGHPSRTEGYR